MTNETMAMEHLGDEELVQLLDGEAAEGERTAWFNHLGDCLPCSERMQELESASCWLQENVAALDAGIGVDELTRARALSAARRARPLSAVRHPLRQPGWSRVAAAIALVVVAGLAVEPVRAWVLDNAGRLMDRVDSAPASTAVARGSISTAPIVSFATTEPLFRVELDQPQSAGELTIRVAPVDAASAGMTEVAEESLSVLPGGLLIENNAASVASYTIELPVSTVRRVQVLAGGRLLLDASVGSEAETIVVDLAAPPAAP